MKKRLTTNGKVVTVGTINGIDKVNDHMYVGGDPVYCRDLDADVDMLNEHVDLIIDCRAERFSGWDTVPELDVPILHVPMYDDMRNSNKIDDFVGALMRMQEMIGEGTVPGNPTLFIHCHMGINRGPSMAMFFLMVEHNMKPVEAFTLLREKRPDCGVAYDALAVDAMLQVIGAQGPVIEQVRADWQRFERSYWTRERGDGVKRRVMSNRHFDRVSIDNKGRAHATGKEG